MTTLPKFSVLQKIKQDIIEGVLPAGEPLKIDVLKERYQTGGSPIREALNQLAAENCIKFVKGKGFQAYALSLVQVEDIYTARIVIEKEALGQAIDHATDETNAVVVASHYKLSALESNVDFRKHPSVYTYLERYRVFHLSLFASCPSETLQRILYQLYEQSERYRYNRLIHIDLLANIDEKAEQHTALVDHYLCGKKSVACKLLTTLLQSTVDKIQGQLKADF